MNELRGQGSDAAKNSGAAVVIIGSGQAGGRAAEAWRAGGHAGPITLIGDESHPPYERPALSKGFLNDARLEQIAWVRPGGLVPHDRITPPRRPQGVWLD